jgi:hypothetical protein
MCLLSSVNKVVISAFAHSNNIYIMQRMHIWKDAHKVWRLVFAQAHVHWTEDD